MDEVPFNEPPSQDTNLFTTPEPAAAATVMSDQGVDRTARLASFANADLHPDDILGQMQAQNDKYRQLIKSQGDDSVRTTAAALTQKDELRSLTNLYSEIPHDAKGDQDSVVSAAAQVANEDMAKKKSYALEQRALQKVHDLAGSDPTQAKILFDNLARGDATQVIQDINTKYSILQTEIDKMSVDADSQPWWTHVAHFVTSMLPLKNSWADVGNSDIQKTQSQWYDFLLSGQRVNREASSLWALPVDQFKDYVHERLLPNIQHSATLGPWRDKDNELRLLTNFAHTPTATQQNMSDVLDNAALIPISKIAKLGSLPYTLIRMGARKEAVDMMVKAGVETATDGAVAAEAKTGVSAAQLEEAALPTAVNPHGTVPAASIAGDVSDILAKASEVRERYGLIQPGRMADQEFQEILSQAKAMTGKLPYVKDVAVKTEALADGSEIPYTELTIGRSGATGYAKSSQLKSWLANHGMQSAEVFKDESGQWFGKVRINIPETGFYVNKVEPLATNNLSRWVLGARRVGDEWLQRLAVVSTNTKAGMLKKLANEFQATFSSLRPDEADRVAGLLARGEREGKWYDEAEADRLFNSAYKRSITPKELTAYKAARDANDVEHVLRNDDLYKGKVIKGFETVTADHPMIKTGAERANAIVERGDVKVTRPVFDATLGRYVENVKPDALSDYVKVNFEQPIELTNGDKVKSVIGKKGDFNFEPLRRDQLAYRAGGHRIYDTKYFLKQASTGSLSTGEAYLENPNVFATGKTMAQMKFLAERLEAARVAYTASGSVQLDVLEDILGGHPGLPSAEDFAKFMEDGTYSKEHSFEALYDREMPAEYTRSSNRINYADGEEDGHQGWLRTTGRMFYGRKGSVLPDWQGDAAPLLDPYKTISKALENIANLSSWSDYKSTAVQRWYDSFKDYIDHSSLPVGASPATAFQDARMVKGGSSAVSKIKMQAETQRAIIARNIGWTTEKQFQARQITRDLIEWVGGREPGTLRDKASAMLTDWATNEHPIQALRGLAFDAKLGLFNVGQLPLQVGTAVAAISMSTRYGLQGLFNAKMMRAFLTKAGTEDMLNTLVERGAWKSAGFNSPEEWKLYMQTAKKSGFFDIGGTHTLGNYLGSDITQSDLMNAQRKFRSAGRFFFNEGEMINRMVGWHIAWKETAESFPELSKTAGKDFINRVSQRADDYTFNMTTASEAYWQKGVLSIPTQFWAYNERMLEAMLGGNFTRAQRVRLVLGQTLLYGSAGIPLVSLGTEAWKNADPQTDGTNPLDTARGAVDRGLLDEIMYHATGADNQFGKRLGTGNWISDSVREIFGWGQYGKKSLADIAGGATLGILGQTAQDLSKVAWYVVAENGQLDDEVTRDSVINLTNNVSTLGNLTKALMIHKYGELLSAKGTVMASDVPHADAFAQALGFAPGAADTVASLSAHKTDRAQIVTDGVKTMTNYRQQYINEPDRREELGRQMDLFSKTLPDDIRMLVMQKVNKTFDPSLYDKLSRTIGKEKMQQQLMNEVETPDVN